MSKPEYNTQHPDLIEAVNAQCAAGCVSTVDEFCEDPQEMIDYSIAALDMWRKQLACRTLSNGERDHAQQMLAFHQQGIKIYKP